MKWAENTAEREGKNYMKHKHFVPEVKGRIEMHMGLRECRFGFYDIETRACLKCWY